MEDANFDLMDDNLSSDDHHHHCYSLSPADSGSLPISPASTSPSSYHSSGGEDNMDMYQSILQQAENEIFRPKDEDYDICRVSLELQVFVQKHCLDQKMFPCMVLAVLRQPVSEK